MSLATADALRAFMTKNHVKVVVDSGEVRLADRFPNEKIDTGHSCTVTAEARDIQAEVSMLPNTVELDPIGILYLDEVQNSIAVADVRHSLKDVAGYQACGELQKSCPKNLQILRILRGCEPHLRQSGRQQRHHRMYRWTGAPHLRHRREGVR